jgi:hypothetical protein
MKSAIVWLAVSYFHFKDGSLHDETAIFSQRRQFRLLSDHLVQKGPAFEHPIDLILNGQTRQITIRYTDDGKEKTTTEHLPLPSDVANGLLLTILKNLPPETADTSLSFVAPTSKPKLVKLVITSQGEETFLTGDMRRKAMHYVLKFEIGGLSGVLAGLLKKQPPDSHVWILQGEAPAFIKWEGPLALGSPSWRIELVSPAWPRSSTTQP